MHLMQGLENTTLSQQVPVIPNAPSPTKTSIFPLLASSFNAQAGAIIGTAGQVIQLLIKPHDDYGNVANVTSPEAFVVTVTSASGGLHRRSLQQSSSIAVLDVRSQP